MKVIIAGSRTATADDVRRALAACPWAADISVVISGTASGADQFGEQWAAEHGLSVERYPADWNAYGKRAGPMRNAQMAEIASGLIAVWDGQSRGTQHMISIAGQRGLRVFVHRIKEVARSDSALSGIATESPVDKPASTKGGLATPVTRQVRPPYRLNALLSSLPADATVVAGVRDYVDQAQLVALRAELRETHVVRRAKDQIEVIAHEAAGAVVGERREILLGQAPDLGQSLLLDWLYRSLRHLGLRMSFGKGARLEYLSERRSSNFLAEVLPNVGLPDGVGRRVAAEFCTRRILGNSGQLRLVVTIQIKTRNTLECSVADLLPFGLDLQGRYVEHAVTNGSETRWRLAGRVGRVDGQTIFLDAKDREVEFLSADSARLEPRKENIEAVLEAVVGAGRAVSALRRLDQLVAERLGGLQRLTLIEEWVQTIRRLPNSVIQGIPVRFDDSTMSADRGRFPPNQKYDRPRLVFDLSQSKTAEWNQGGLDKYGPYNFERFSPKRLNIAVICQASRQGDVERFVDQLLDGIPGSKYAENGFVRRFHLERPFIRTFTAKSAAVRDYREAVAAAIDDSTTRNQAWNLALLQIDREFQNLRGDDNPYLVCKALFLVHRIQSQAFQWESIRPGLNIEGTVNNIGLAAYAKVEGTPWLLPAHQSVAHELVVGLGSYEASNARIGRRERYVGVTTVFTADGRYLLESRTPATPADEYFPALLRTLEGAIGEARRYAGWQLDDPVRLNFHAFKDFNGVEIHAVRSLMTRLGMPHAQFAFLHLVDDHPYLVFDPEQRGTGGPHSKGATVPPRGLRVDLDHNESLLCLKGHREVKSAAHGMPRPILLRLHKASTFKDMNYLARQVYDFSCLSWRSMSPSAVPITILYSDQVAKMLLLLRDVKGWSPEHILGSVGRTRWFL